METKVTKKEIVSTISEIKETLNMLQWTISRKSGTEFIYVTPSDWVQILEENICLSVRLQELFKRKYVAGV